MEAPISARARESTETPFEGDLDSLEVPPYQARRNVPTVRIGSSSWYFNVEQGIYDGSVWDSAVSDVPRLPIGACDGDFHYDQSVYYFDPSGAAGMAWDERVTCAFKLLLPARIPPLALRIWRATSELRGPYRDCSTPLQSRRACEPTLTSQSDAWIIGESVLRDGRLRTARESNSIPRSCGIPRWSCWCHETEHRELSAKRWSLWPMRP